MDKTGKGRASGSSQATGRGTTVGRPRKLSPEAIVQAALAIVDDEGMDKLSIRSLAKRLNVQANAIYTYYDNLEEIENAVVTQLLGEIPQLGASGSMPMRQQYIEHYVALRAAHVMHPRVMVGKVGSPAWISNARHLNGVLTQMVADGLDVGSAMLAHTALSGVAVMSAMQANADRKSDATLNRREAIAAIKAIKADHVIELMNRPQMKLSAEERFRESIGNLIDTLVPGLSAKATRKTARRS